MRIIDLGAQSGKCRIVLGESVENIADYCDSKNPVAITDAHVLKNYGNALKNCEIIEIGIGEGAKTLETIESIYSRFLALELDRSSVVVGVGCGIVCDVAGFAAATYLRGLRFGTVPTTLLAQVDASIGGKNGVNFNGYKNLIGTIRQPEFCICDFDVLRTLPQSEIRSGLAEIIKHAVIGDKTLFAYLEDNAHAALSLHRTVIEKIIHDSLAVKIAIVKKDEFEKYERMKLNFGHTIGHAIEKLTKVTHGEAVAIGMVAATNLSVANGIMRKEECEKLKSLLSSAGLPITMNSKDHEAIIDAITKDKKRKSKVIRMVLPESIGKVRIEEIDIEKLKGVISDMC